MDCLMEKNITFEAKHLLTYPADVNLWKGVVLIMLPMDDEICDVHDNVIQIVHELVKDHEITK